jgi:hypothetical protein
VEYKFSFTSRRAFALLMIKPVIMQLRQDAQLRRLVGLKPDMDGKVLVTEATSCPAYALILSEGIESEAVIGFQLSASAPETPIVGFGGGIKAKWTVSSSSGQWRYGSSDRSEPNSFYPLFTLRSLSKSSPLGSFLHRSSLFDLIPAHSASASLRHTKSGRGQRFE